MSKTKMDFIADLLNSKILEPAYKEKFFLLAFEEIKNSEKDDKKIWKEIDALKMALNARLKESEEESVTAGFIPKHKPKDVADFMTLFNKRDGLKYLTHDFDEVGTFEIETFLKRAQKIFFTNTRKDKFSIPKKLYEIINQFAFSSDPDWTNSDKQIVNSGWSTNEWINWSKKNKLHPIRHEGFKEIINSFRQLIRIESPVLENQIQKIITKVFDGNNSFSIEQNSLSKADFYTHVPSFEKAITAIFELMKLREDNRNIEISYDRSTDGDYFVRKLILNQIGAGPTKELDVLVSEWKSEKGAMGGIRNNLYGFCNWSVETIIEEKAVRINILKDENTNEIEFLTPLSVDGFKHILTFYYR
jgi:hypothetical protein